MSTDEQNLDLQWEALKDAGCEIVFVPTVWNLDRLGRPPFDLVNFVEDLRARDIGLKVLTGQRSMLDTTRPEGRLIFGVFAALAEYERELIGERTKGPRVGAVSTWVGAVVHQ